MPFIFIINCNVFTAPVNRVFVLNYSMRRAGLRVKTAIKRAAFGEYMSFVQKKKLGLALGGGGSRAICHLGVLAALEKAGIKVDMISGNSMGGIIGAVYATGCGIEKTKEDITSCFGGGGLIKMRKGDGLERDAGWFQYLKRNLRALTISLVLSFRRGFLWSNPCRKAVNSIIPDINIEELPLPYSVVALNLTDGELANFTNGPLRMPVLVGTNVGVVFPPLKYNDKEYVDAAPICAVPVDQARELGAEVVLAVDIRTPLPEKFKVLNGFDTIFRIESVESNIINSQLLERADIVIRPEAGNLFWGDFSENDRVIKSGEEAVEAIVDQLKELLG